MKKIISSLLFIILMICLCSVALADDPMSNGPPPVVDPQGTAINNTNFPDAVFQEYVKQFDTDKNGFLNNSEIAAVTKIAVVKKGISSLQGIDFFTELTKLECEKNSLTTLDVSKNSKLEYLSCWENGLTSLDVSKNKLLKYLYCDNNNLSSLDVSKNSALKELNCTECKLFSLIMGNNSSLTELICNDNKLKSLNLSSLKSLKLLFCYHNSIAQLDISQCPVLIKLMKSTNCVDLGVYICWYNDNRWLYVDQGVGIKAKKDRIYASVMHLYPKSGKKSLTLKWTKDKNVNGYEIQYGLKKNWSDAKTIKISKAKTSSKTIKKLKSGKTYYIRIRGYKSIKGEKYYSEWATKEQDVE